MSARMKSAKGLRAEFNLGVVCRECGSDVHLEIDHTEGAERSERRRQGKRSTYIAVRDCAAGNTEGYQLLCRKCHRVKTNADRAARRNGFA
ncbi:MAG: hypothetical protein ACLQRH_17000 [Acidimicrobiales bacterium]